ncbi:hypothetical protein K7432_016524 [Basidiobolus ranarum]|uniref:Cytochrome P450 n=1 Tax=Basidiobolus ranarum TaxID=34480 RepID=A0ABR2WEK4_9FUNG
MFSSSNGKDWKLRRGVVNPLFRLGWEPAKFGKVVLDLITSIDEADSTPELYQIMKFVALDTLGSVLYGFDFQAIRNPASEHVEVYFSAVDAASDIVYMLVPILDSFPIGRRTKDHQAVENFRQMLRDLALKKSLEIQNGSDEQKTQDILTVLVQAWLDKRLELEEIIDEMSVFLLAGHDTTANSLTCAIYLLAKHKDIQVKVRDEVARAFRAHTSTKEIPSTAEIKSLEYLDAVIKETLRLYPSAPLLPTRTAARNTTIGDVPVPKGALVTLNIYALHRSDEYWENPNEFDPDRWLTPEGRLRDLPAWNPFSGGERTCVGQGFSVMEMKITLSMLVRRYQLQVPDDSPHSDEIQFKSTLLLHPRDLFVKFILLNE